MKIRLPISQLPINSDSKPTNLIIPLIAAGKALLPNSKKRFLITGPGKTKYTKQIFFSSSHYLVDEIEVEVAQNYKSNMYHNMAKNIDMDYNTDDSGSLYKQSYQSKCKYRYNKGKTLESRKRRQLEFEEIQNSDQRSVKQSKNSASSGFYSFLPCSKLRLVIVVSAFLVTILYNSFSWNATIIEKVSMAFRNSCEISGSFNLLPHQCHFPKLDSKSPEVVALFNDTLKVSHNETFCSEENNGQKIVFIADHQYLTMEGKLVIHEKKNPDKNYKKPSCCYKAFRRIDEKENWVSHKCVKIDMSNNQTKIKVNEEFISLECKMPVFQKDYRDMFAFVPDKPEVESRVNKINSHLTSNGQKREDKISVILFGMDAVSHLNFQRQMPLSRSYLVNVLRAIPLNGYTKVAENTLPNVIPLLSGMALSEFYDECIKTQEKKFQDSQQNNPFFFTSESSNSISLDECPFIWKWFSSQGYRTSFAEDQNNIGIFQMYWSKSFKEQPTDYYLKTLTRQMEELFQSPSGQCLGSRLSFKVLLDHMINVANAFKNRLFFQFSWSTRLSHDKMELLHWGDKDLYKSLKSLHDDNHLNNTVLILLSDHGSRLDKIRKLYQGQIEDRMPLAYIVVPPWFKNKYPQAMKNLRTNSQRLTSAFDVHKTLLDLTHLNNLNDENIKWKDGVGKLSEKTKYQRYSYRSRNHFVDEEHRIITRQSKSLFEKLDEDRSCMEAGVPLHWCLCQIKEPVDRESFVVKQAVQFVLDKLNQYIQLKEKQIGSNICEILHLNQITEAFKWKDEKVIVKSTEYNIRSDYKYHPSSEKKNASTNSSQDFKLNDVLILQISFITDPGEGAFEATVVQLPPSKANRNTEWMLTEKIARTNSYSDQSYCVEDYDLKEYCYCSPNMEYFM